MECRGRGGREGYEPWERAAQNSRSLEEESTIKEVRECVNNVICDVEHADKHIFGLSPSIKIFFNMSQLPDTTVVFQDEVIPRHSIHRRGDDDDNEPKTQKTAMRPYYQAPPSMHRPDRADRDGGAATIVMTSLIPSPRAFRSVGFTYTTSLINVPDSYVYSYIAA
jgi:hypothetical protein